MKKDIFGKPIIKGMSFKIDGRGDYLSDYEACVNNLNGCISDKESNLNRMSIRGIVNLTYLTQTEFMKLLGL